MSKRACVIVIVLVGTMAGSKADENDWFRPLGRPPKAAPRRISAGEALPPLPLPATPLRRSERKRQPSPPTLAGKVMWGETALFTYDNGAATQIADWNLCPADLQQLTAKAARWFGLSYRSEAVALPAFHGDPARLPLLFFSGGRTLTLDDKQQDLLRTYVISGGMLVFDAPAGSPYFYESAKKLVQQTLPEFKIRVVPLDHPVYHMLYDVEQVQYPRNLDAELPFLEGVYVGCRLGVLISKYGLGCGWDDHEVPMIEQAIYYDVDSANKLGLNLVAYAVGYGVVGREEAKPEFFGALDEKHPTDEFVFAQLRHEGAWNVHPGAAAALLRRLRQSTSLRVSLKRVPVKAGADDLSPFPFLFLSGLDDMVLDDQAVASLRHFLNSAGTLFINNGLGMKTFDRAVKREIKKVLPGAAFVPVPLDHPLFSSVFHITESRYTPVVTAQQEALTTPYLEGITLNGDLRVIYSPYDIAAAWQGCEHPLARAYEPLSGTELGINVVMYAMTH